jgi:hypothetical protein
MTGDKQVDKFVKKLAPPQKRIVSKLRELILTNLPDVKEEYKWNVPYYSPVCYIAVHPHHVNLGFCFGSLLPHKFGYRMEGKGKYMRHVKIKKLADIKKQPLTKLMHEAMTVFTQSATLKNS